MKTLSLIVLVLSFAITTPVMARDKNDEYSIRGPITCGVWVKDRQKDDWGHVSNALWIAGFFTAYNLQTPDVYDILGSTDLESALLWMDKYCQENPLSTLAGGMEFLTAELWPNRKRNKHD